MIAQLDLIRQRMICQRESAATGDATLELVKQSIQEALAETARAFR